MSTTEARQTATLVVLSPGPQQGRHLPLPPGTSVVGRGVDCDVRLEDPTVSRRHAKLVREGDAVVVVDLGSRCGTTVAGRPVTDAAVLAPGEEVAFAAVTLRLAVAAAPDRDSAPAVAPPHPRSSYDVGSQHAGSISNVGNDQYVSYVQHVVEQRESFLAHVASTRTRARWLVWLGLALLAPGMVAFLRFFLDYFLGIYRTLAEAFADPESAPAFPDFSLEEVGGVPVVAIGIVLPTVGQLLIIVGIVLHVVASARARRVDRELPLPPPGPSGWPHP